MLSAFISSLRTADLRRKILFTLGIVILYRVGASIPSPGVNYPNVQKCVAQVSGGDSAQIYSLINLFSGGALLHLTVFAVGVMPYITASIIVQLLTVVIPRFEQLRKEGQAGQAKMTQYTRYLAVALAILQATSIVALAANGGLLQGCTLDIIQGQSRGPEHLHAGRHRAGDDRRRGAGDVDGRAGHRARHRQRHVAADLRRHRRAHPGRRQDHPGQPRRPGVRPGLRGRADHHHRRGVRRAGPTAHPGAVRQAHGGPAHVRRHVDVSAAQGQPGRRYPGDLRVVADLHPAPDHPADPQRKLQSRQRLVGHGSSPTT